MTKGIIIKGSTGTKIRNNTFVNLDVAIEAENSKDTELDNNIVIDDVSKQKQKDKNQD